MSGHTRKHPTKTKAVLKREITAKLAKVTNTEDLLILNKVIDKYVPAEEKSFFPKDVFGDDWTDKAKKLGRIIQGLRFREGMNQSQVAKSLRGVKQSNISAWENGKEQVPKKRLRQLSDLFGTDLLKLSK
jgi:ribosome-binding protein aMBF1 (putative translation factor)